MHNLIEHLNNQAEQAMSVEKGHLFLELKQRIEDTEAHHDVNREGDHNSKNGCMICASARKEPQRRLIIGVNDLATTAPSIAAEWHPTKNGKLSPQNVQGHTAKKVWWKCPKNHEWEDKVTNRNTGSDCRECDSIPLQKDINDLQTINPRLAAEWHPTKNKGLTPDQVLARSRKKAWWLGECSHEWSQVIADRNAGNSCPYCNGRKLQTGFNDLETVSPLLTSQWHPTKNGDLTPSQVRPKDDTEVWWFRSDCGHEWETKVNSRNNGSECQGCSKSVSKAEKRIKAHLESLGFIVQGSNRKILKPKEIDLYIEDKNFGIEFNGVYWHSEHRKKGHTDSHINKYKNAEEAGVKLVQIWEDDWNENPELILKNLAKQLNSSSNQHLLSPIFITSSEAESFLKQNHIQGFASGDFYLGSVDPEGTVQSALVLNKGETDDGTTMHIQRYSAKENNVSDLHALLQEAHEVYGTKTFTVTTDNCEGEGNFYKASGFTIEREIPQEYMHIIRGKRVSTSEYPVERFRNDPNLQWKDGMTEKELGELNDWGRIWDAGKTIYRFDLK